jgi:hypothetical protein
MATLQSAGEPLDVRLLRRTEQRQSLPTTMLAPVAAVLLTTGGERDAGNSV